jgi:hypothetical protein
MPRARRGDTGIREPATLEETDISTPLVHPATVQMTGTTTVVNTGLLVRAHPGKAVIIDLRRRPLPGFERTSKSRRMTMTSTEHNLFGTVP